LRLHPTLHMEMIWRHAAAQKDMCSNYREAPLIGAIRQPSVTTSTTEAELLALTHSAKEVNWWRRFFAQLGFDLGYDFTIHCPV
jgi:hypothetical protein